MDNQNKDIPLKAVTLFFDIGRESFQQPRDVGKYIENFLIFFCDLKCDLLVVTNEHLKKRIELAVANYETTFSTNLTYHVLDFENLPLYDQYLEIDQTLGSSAMAFFSMRDRFFGRRELLTRAATMVLNRRKPEDIFSHIPLRDASVPEYKEAKYLITVLSKPFVMNIAYQSGFCRKNEPIAFMDFGFGHGSNSLKVGKTVKTLVRGSYNPGQIVLTKRLPTKLSRNVWDYAQLVDDAIVPTGLIVLDFETLEILNNWWSHAIKLYLSQSIIPDDQTLIAIFGALHPEITRFIETFDLEHLTELEKWLPIRGYLAAGNS
jgi:hypothetical protein